MSLLIHGGKVTLAEARGARAGLKAVAIVLLALAASGTATVALAGSALLLVHLGHDSEHRPAVPTAVVGQCAPGVPLAIGTGCPVTVTAGTAVVGQCAPGVPLAIGAGCPARS